MISSRGPLIAAACLLSSALILALVVPGDSLDMRSLRRDAARLAVAAPAGRLPLEELPGLPPTHAPSRTAPTRVTHRAPHRPHGNRAKAPARGAPARKAQRTAARRERRRAAFRLPHRHRPGHIVHGHYLRSLTGGPGDRRRMWHLGAVDAGRNPGGMAHLVLLDIGGQARRGVFLSVVNRFISYRRLVHAVVAYAAGYHSRQRRVAPVTIAVGTNNDLYTSGHAGRLWATRVVNPARVAIHRYSGITVAGASDIEPGFKGGPRATSAWLRGFLRSTRAPFVFNGSADGCSTRHSHSRCNHGWNSRMLAMLAGGAAPRRIVALPQIYNTAMAAQWAQISRTAKLEHRGALRILGPLTEQAACGRDPACPSMPSRRAWWLLHRKLSIARVRPSSLPVQVDLDVR